jgi:transposase
LASRVDLFLAIRIDYENGMGMRAIARKYGVHRRTVHQALASPVPPARKSPRRAAPVLGPWKETIDGWLREDLRVHRKQRHTAARIHERLVAECRAVIGYSAVQRYVKARRPQIRAEAERGPGSGFVPQAHRPGAEAEVDFGQVTFMLRGQEVTAWLFVLRLSYSGFAVHRVFPSQGQDALLAGHIEAFDVLGGVPARQIRYDCEDVRVSSRTVV